MFFESPSSVLSFNTTKAAKIAKGKMENIKEPRKVYFLVEIGPF